MSPLNRVQLWWATLGQAHKQCLGLAGLLLVVMSVLLGTAHGRYGLFDVDEAIFTQATMEMRGQGTTGAETAGTWAMPTYNGEPRYHKPPLIYWAQAGLMNVLGDDPQNAGLWAARLPSALSWLLLVGLVGWAVWRLTENALWALASSAILGLNISALVVARAATADGLLNLFSAALALWVLVVLFPTKQRPAQWYDPGITALLATLGLLAKGPVAGVPAAILFTAVWLARGANSRKQRWQAWQLLKPGQVLLCTALLFTPWLGWLGHQLGWGFFYEFIMVHNLGRFAADMGNTQSDSPFYYLLVLLLGFGPWVWLLPPAVWQAVANWRTARFVAALGSPQVAKALPLLMLLWAGAYILLFSFSGTKLAHYIVPAYPALAILVGWWLTQPRRLERLPRQQVRSVPGWIPNTLGALGLMWIMLLAAVFALLNPLLVGLAQPQLTGWLATAQVWLNFDWPPSDVLALAVLQLPVPTDPGVPLMAAILLVCVAPCWAWLVWGRREDRVASFVALALSWAAVLALVVWALVPQVWARTQAPLAELAHTIRQQPAGTPIIHLGLHKPSVRYLSARPFTKLERPLQLPPTLARLHSPQTLVLTELTEVAPIVQELNAQGGRSGLVVAQQCTGGYCLLWIQK